MRAPAPDWTGLAQAIAAHRRPILGGLADFIRLDTVSQRSERVRAGAEWLTRAMQARGIEARIMENGR